MLARTRFCHLRDDASRVLPLLQLLPACCAL
jgi:hypothetical protein